MNSVSFNEIHCSKKAENAAKSSKNRVTKNLARPKLPSFRRGLLYNTLKLHLCLRCQPHSDLCDCVSFTHPNNCFNGFRCGPRRKGEGGGGRKKLILVYPAP